jgi:hypothetical protein
MSATKAAATFREALSVGDTPNFGVVVEVKRPITKIQTPLGGSAG